MVICCGFCINADKELSTHHHLVMMFMEFSLVMLILLMMND